MHLYMTFVWKEDENGSLKPHFRAWSGKGSKGMQSSYCSTQDMQICRLWRRVRQLVVASDVSEVGPPFWQLICARGDMNLFMDFGARTWLSVGYLLISGCKCKYSCDPTSHRALWGYQAKWCSQISQAVLSLLATLKALLSDTKLLQIVVLAIED